ncbi:MAG TPA: amidohydrolase family protein [Bryobacteraceae bacterium]|nr:amidohydrolase family protein [Bryobacteraceae bacterium]
MTTQWGDIEVSDAHVHFFSPPFFHSLAEQKGGGEAGSNTVRSMLQWDVPATSEDLADRWIEELDRNQVTSAVVVGSIPGDVESVGIAVERYPDRLHSVVMLNPLSHGADTRCSNALGEGFINGVFLFPAMHRFSMQDPKVHSLLSIVAGYPGAVVYVHCGMLSVGFRKKLGLQSPFDMRYSNPIDLHSVALALPNLPFVIPHFGAGYLREALMLADLCPNIYFDTSSSNSWMRCDPSGTDLAGVFRATLNVVGPRRLLFGTDSSWFPRGWLRGIFDTQVRAMADAGVDAVAAQAILGGNLRMLLQKAPQKS